MTVDMFQDQLDAARDRDEAHAIAETKATERLRGLEADFTPRLVCRAVLEAAMLGRVVDRATRSSWIHEPDALGQCIEGGPLTIWPALGLPWVRREDTDKVLTLRVLDVCSGAGVWASEVRRIAAILGIQVHITAVECREEERVSLLRHADEVIIGDWHEALGMVLDEQGRWVFGPDGPREYDLIVGNPAFSHARAPVRPEWEQAAWDAATATVKEAKRRAKEGLDALPALEYANARKEIARLQAKHKDLTQAAVAEGKLEELAKYDPEGSMPALCLRSAPVVVLYLTQQCWTKTASGWLVRRVCPPAVAHDIPGSVAHRGPGVGMDSIPYTGFMWTRGHKGATATNMLEPIESRSWKVRPGTETDEWLTEQGIPFLEDA